MNLSFGPTKVTLLTSKNLPLNLIPTHTAQMALKENLFLVETFTVPVGNVINYFTY